MLSHVQNHCVVSQYSQTLVEVIATVFGICCCVGCVLLLRRSNAPAQQDDEDGAKAFPMAGGEACALCTE